MTDVISAPPNVFVDNPHAPDFWAAGYSGFAVSGDNLVITFESHRVNHATTPGPMTRMVIGRLVLPIGSAQALALDLHGFLAKIGRDPTVAARGGATAQ